MNKPLNINLYYNEDGENIIDVLTKDFNDFLNDYIISVLNKWIFGFILTYYSIWYIHGKWLKS